MKKTTNKAFTLVELIVVITILAILGTIAFISLQGYSAEARDSKRVADTTNITKKMSIEVTKGASLTNMVANGVATAPALTVNGAATSSAEQGKANFVALRENEADFRDAGGNDDYLIGYAIGGSGTGAYKFYQAAATMESTNQARVVGNYYQMAASGDSASVVTDGTASVVNDGTVLPYSITD